MKIVADLHLHSRFSRAVSAQMTLPNMAATASLKGINLLSVADFTHPVWLKEAESQLEEEEEGIYGLKSEYQSTKTKTNFIFSTEIACITKHKDKLRRIHNLIFAPDIQTVEKINSTLIKRGVNLGSDGRPIMGLTSKNILELIMDVDKRCFLIPCHVWTPHFGLYGSASGYDSITEAYDELGRYIYGIETGISSDPDMNWGIKELESRSIVSSSDAHSLPKIGREATVFELERLTYENIRKAVMYQSQVSAGKLAGTSLSQPTSGNHIAFTIEFYPEEGRYHYSGHRNCRISFGPDKIRSSGNICPVCKKRLTEGVLYRVQQLTDPLYINKVNTRKDDNGLLWYSDKQSIHPPYIKLVPLLEVIAKAISSTVISKKTNAIYENLVSRCAPEIDILLRKSLKDIESSSGEEVAGAVSAVRSGNVVIEPGYDGEYGKVRISPGSLYSGNEVDKESQLSLGF